MNLLILKVLEKIAVVKLKNSSTKTKSNIFREKQKMVSHTYVPLCLILQEASTFLKIGSMHINSFINYINCFKSTCFCPNFCNDFKEKENRNFCLTYRNFCLTFGRA